MKSSNFDKAFQALIISLLLHGLITVGIYFAPQPNFVESPITVEILDSSRAKRLIVDETSPTPKDPLLEKLKNQSQLLSKYSKRVKQQQVAHKSGATKNRSGNANVNRKLKSPKLDLKPKTQTPSTNRKKVVRNNSRPLHLPQVRGSMNNTVSLGESTNGNDIPHVKNGYFTALNTDQFTYYSFFERVNQAIRFRWVSGVRKFVREAAAPEINRLARIPAPTLLKVLLDKDGMVVKVFVIKSSGSKALDEAAVQAFYQASPLNHPPDGMIQDDRMVHLHFSFKVELAPVYMAKDKSP